MQLQSRIRSARRLVPLAAALLLAVPSSTTRPWPKPSTMTLWRWRYDGIRPNAHYLLALQDLADGMGLGHMLPKVRVRHAAVRTGGPFPD